MDFKNITAQGLSIIPQSESNIVFNIKMEYEDIYKLLDQIDFGMLEDYVEKNRPTED